MNQAIQILNEYNIYITIGLIIFSLILFILLLVSLNKLKRIQNKYQAFMKKEDIDIEALLIQYACKVNEVAEQQNEMKNIVKSLQDELKFCVQKVGVVRYQAIQGVGADLSFVIALLDQNDDGVVINGIYSREGSYTYAKPIQKGVSKYTLSEEEQEAIERAKINE